MRRRPASIDSWQKSVRESAAASHALGFGLESFSVWHLRVAISSSRELEDAVTPALSNFSQGATHTPCIPGKDRNIGGY